MKYLIDTQVFLWHMMADKHLPASYQLLIENNNAEIYLSHASLWEMAIKISIWKLTLTIPFDEIAPLLSDKGFKLLHFDFPAYQILQKLPHHHKDPFDRMIIAQAIANDLPVMSTDKAFSRYAVELV